MIEINIHYFSDKLVALAEGIVATQSEKARVSQNKNKLGFIQRKGKKKYSIGIELELLKDPTNMIATMAHELHTSHYLAKVDFRKMTKSLQT